MIDIDKITQEFREDNKNAAGIFERPAIMPTDFELDCRFQYFEKDGRSLFDFQKETMRWLTKGPCRILADGPGLNTRTEIVSVLPDHQVAGTIIVCPAGSKWMWLEELILWRPDLYVFEKGRKDFEIPEPGEVFLMSWDSLPKEVNIKKYDPFVLVLADVENAKRTTSARSRRIQELLDMTQAVIATVPYNFMRKAQDLYGMLVSVGVMDYLEAGYFSEFKEAYFDKEDKDYTPNLVLKEFLHSIILRRDVKEVSQLHPPIRKEKRYASVDVEFRNLLNSYIRKLGGIEKSADKITEEAEIPKQISELMTSLKYPMLQDIMSAYEIADTPLVVYTSCEKTLKQIDSRNQWAVISEGTSMEERGEILSQFSRGKRKFIAVSHKVMTGLLLENQTEDCITIVRVEPDLDKEVNEYNLHKIQTLATRRSEEGYLRIVHLIDLHLHNKIDQLFWKILDKKPEKQELVAEVVESS